MSYTQEQRRQAVDLYIADGMDTATDQVGCSRMSVYRWLGDFGVDVTDEKKQGRREETALRHEAKRQAIREALLDKSLDLLNRMDEEHIDYRGRDSDKVTFPKAPADAVRSYATSVGILIDKFRLEVGEYTDRTYSEGSDDVDRRIQQLVGEITRRAEAEARQKPLA